MDTRKLRQGLGLNQAEFWERLQITHSGGSRYENGRTMPRPVRRLLGLVYLKEKLVALHQREKLQQDLKH